MPLNKFDFDSIHTNATRKFAERARAIEERFFRPEVEKNIGRWYHNVKQQVELPADVKERMDVRYG